MKCDEVREQLLVSEGETPEVVKHIENCAACTQWLNEELSKPLDGITPPAWEPPTAACMPEVPSNLLQEKKDKPSLKELGFFAIFKHGLVFGIMIGLGIAISLSFNDKKDNFNPTETYQMVSFFDYMQDEIPTFFEYKNNNVTFLQQTDSYMLSFVNDNEIPSFINLTQEELTWLE